MSFNGLKILTDIDLTVGGNWTTNSSTNYGFYLQVFWDGVAGDGKYFLEASNNGTHWEKYPTFKPIESVWTLEREISGATGSSSIHIFEWFPDYLRVTIEPNTATSGNVSALFTMINKQDVNV